jgi:hypothetical protein
VQPGDVLKHEWKDFDFTRDIWGKGERESFLSVLKEGMAGRAGHGRGRGRGRGEDFWVEGQKWWNAGYHPGNPLQIFSLPSVTTLIHLLCNIRINRICSFKEQGKAPDSSNN